MTKYAVFFILLCFLTACKSEHTKLKSFNITQDLKLRNGFIVPPYAQNVMRSAFAPKDIFYFEIDKPHSDTFLKSANTYQENCHYLPQILESMGKDYKNKFENYVKCHELNDGEAIKYETLVIAKKPSDAGLYVFYAYWDNSRE